MKRKDFAAHECQSCHVITKSRIALLKGAGRIPGYAYMCPACKKRYGLDRPRAL
jgi:hypothetical protein